MSDAFTWEVVGKVNNMDINNEVFTAYFLLMQNSPRVQEIQHVIDAAGRKSFEDGPMRAANLVVGDTYLLKEGDVFIRVLLSKCDVEKNKGIILTIDYDYCKHVCELSNLFYMPDEIFQISLSSAWIVVKDSTLKPKDKVSVRFFETLVEQDYRRYLSAEVCLVQAGP